MRDVARGEDRKGRDGGGIEARGTMGPLRRGQQEKRASGVERRRKRDCGSSQLPFLSPNPLPLTPGLSSPFTMGFRVSRRGP